MLRKLFLLCILMSCAACGKILCVFPSPFVSHQSVFRVIWTELLARGHEVTVITTNPIRGLLHENLTQVDLSFTYELTFRTHKMDEILAKERNLLMLMHHLHRMTALVTDEQLKHPAVQEVIRSNRQFDLILAEAAAQAWLALSSKFKCPVVSMSSLDATFLIQESIGNPTNYYLYPDFNLPYEKELTFAQTVVSVLFANFVKAVQHYFIIPRHNELARTYIDKNTPDLTEIEKNISVFFATVIPGFNRVRANVPTLIELNGLHLKPPGTLPQEIETFLDSSPKGVIYCSLGSTFKSAFMPLEKRQALLDAFSELPYKVLWKYEGSDVNDLPKNVKAMQWVPQQDVLRHRNLKLFIMQGGLQSIEEAIAYKVPMIGIPIFGDQLYNVKRLQHLGLGVEVNYDTLTKDSLKRTVTHIMTNRKRFRSKLQRLANFAAEQPVKPLDEAMFWIEYVIRHKGTRHLRSPAIDVPFYKFYLLDVIAAMILGVLLLLYLILKAFRCVLRLFMKISGRIKSKIE